MPSPEGRVSPHPHPHPLPQRCSALTLGRPCCVCVGAVLKASSSPLPRLKLIPTPSWHPIETRWKDSGRWHSLRKAPSMRAADLCSTGRSQCLPCSGSLHTCSAKDRILRPQSRTPTPIPSTLTGTPLGLSWPLSGLLTSHLPHLTPNR